VNEKLVDQTLTAASEFSKLAKKLCKKKKISIWAVRAAYIVSLEVMNKAIEDAGKTIPEEFDEQAKQLARIWLTEMRR
jgi:diacylglycerol kinase